MGFFSGLGKLLGGKPVFDDVPSERDDTAFIKREIHQDEGLSQPQSPPQSPFLDQHGNKITPQVTFRHLKSRMDQAKATTMAWVANTSKFEIELLRTEVLGHKQEIRRVLRPSEEHEVKVYDGPLITNDHDHSAKLYLKIHENDDLFVEEYTIEYNLESNGTFTIEELHRTNPAPRDI